MKDLYYNIDDAEFIGQSGEKLSRCVPELFYQENAKWRIFLRDRENRSCDLSGIVVWGAAVDCDYRADTAPMCRALSEDIVADAQTGSVTVVLDTATAEFLAAVDGSSRRRAYFALWGLTSGGERELYLEFEISARMIVDPDPTVSPQTPDTVATRNYVSAMMSSGAAAAGAIMSGAEFKTSVGSYTVALTSGGGLMISGGGVALNVSSGAVLAKYDNGDEVLPESATFTLTSGGVNAEVFDGIAGERTAFALGKGVLIASGANGESVVLSGGTVSAVAGYTTLGLDNGGFSVETPTESMTFDGYDLFVRGEKVLNPISTVVDSETTSAVIEVLSGGTSFVYTQPLTSLSVASVASSEAEAWLEFTVASGGSVSINDSGYKWLGGRPSAYEGGSSYAVGFRWGREAVCSPLEE